MMAAGGGLDVVDLVREAQVVRRVALGRPPGFIRRETCGRRRVAPWSLPYLIAFILSDLSVAGSGQGRPESGEVGVGAGENDRGDPVAVEGVGKGGEDHRIEPGGFYRPGGPFAPARVFGWNRSRQHREEDPPHQ